VADAGENLIAHVRMDEAWLGSIEISIKKAYTSRAFDISQQPSPAEVRMAEQRHYCLSAR